MGYTRPTSHRLSRAGDRQLNYALHVMAITQMRHDAPGRVYYQRKRAAGKSYKEALRCLKRRLSEVVHRTLLRDAGRRAWEDIRGRLCSPARPAQPRSRLFGQVTSRTRRDSAHVSEADDDNRVL
jgi:hypothetical protein